MLQKGRDSGGYADDLGVQGARSNAGSKAICSAWEMTCNRPGMVTGVHRRPEDVSAQDM